MLVYTLIRTLTQYFFVVLMAPLFAGIIANLKAKVESRKGPSIFQPYYDLFKYMRKQVLIPDGSGLIFKYAPFILFGIYSLIALIVPIVIPEPVFFTASADFLGGAILFSLAAFVKIAAAFDSRSNFTALGAVRALSFNFLSEATLITVFFAVSLITDTNNPYITNSFLATHYLQNISLEHIFATIAFFMLFLYETGKLPLESSGLAELGMIEEGMSYEYSGKLLSISKWSGYMKQYILGAIFLNVFFIPWGLQSSFPGFLLDIPVMFLKWLLLIVIVVVIETTFAKMRLFRIQDYLATSFTFSILFLIFSVVIA
ncbi:MAG: respiratory chain complex I subunit 1 family protein [Candidatus Thermoplasmatota archaeon]|nr:respiratory chain complex I subunit 1 family protein [Candidatus Thermoplasmatota archaeon]